MAFLCPDVIQCFVICMILLIGRHESKKLQQKNPGRNISWHFNANTGIQSFLPLWILLITFDNSEASKNGFKGTFYVIPWNSYPGNGK